MQSPLSSFSTLKIQWLEYFVVLVEQKGLSQAAKHLAASESSLRRNIKDLEEHMQTRLFKRMHKDAVELSAQGKSLYLSSERLLRRAQFFSPLSVSEKPNLWMGGDVSHIADFIAETATQLKQTQDFNLALNRYWDVNYRSNIEMALLQNNIELAFKNSPAISPLVQSRLLFNIPLVIAGRPQAKKKWQSLNYIIHRSFSRTTRLPINVITYCNSLAINLFLCKQGYGVGIFPEMWIHKELEEGTLEIITEGAKPMDFSVFLLFKDSLPEQGLAGKFKNLLIKESKNYVPFT